MYPARRHFGGIRGSDRVMPGKTCNAEPGEARCGARPGLYFQLCRVVLAVEVVPHVKTDFCHDAGPGHGPPHDGDHR